MRKAFTPLETIIAAAEVLRHEARNISEADIRAIKRNILEVADCNGERPSYVAKCMVVNQADRLLSRRDIRLHNKQQPRDRKRHLSFRKQDVDGGQVVQ